jgi:putative oxidoreductase
MTELTSTLRAATALLGRLLLAYLFIREGIGKITDYASVQDYMAQFGVSPSILPLVVLTELGGGLLVAFGGFTRAAAVALAGFALLTAWFFHRGDDADSMVHFMKNISIAGGFLVLAANGAGAWSLDALVSARRQTGGAIGNAPGGAVGSRK